MTAQLQYTIQHRTVLIIFPLTSRQTSYFKCCLSEVRGKQCRPAVKIDTEAAVMIYTTLRIDIEPPYRYRQYIKAQLIVWQTESTFIQKWITF